MTPRIRVLVVDDSVVMRRVITEALSQDPAFEVVGVAANGAIALQKISQLSPDAVTLDVEMPELNGVETVRAIRRTHPRLPVVMCSALTRDGADATLEALAAGANDWVAKPGQSTTVAETIARISADLIPRLRALCAASPAGRRTVESPVVPAVVTRQRRRAPSPDVLAIATSTGGPNALSDLFLYLTLPLPVPVALVQHMPPVFTKSLADRLTRETVHHFHEAEDGQELMPGHVYIAPGGRHMEVERAGVHIVARLHDAAPENSCRPAADVLFRSIARVYGGATLACVLTGMGQDGLRGCELIHEAGGQILIQDEKSSVVWGMPGAIARAGIADAVLPLNRMAAEIQSRVFGLALALA